MRKATELIKRLEQMVVEEGDHISKKICKNLKDGNGTCSIYQETREYLDKTVYVAGYIAMELGASIGLHLHVNDSETYTVLAGKVMSNDKIYLAGESIVCDKNGVHDCVNMADGESVLRFVKRN